MPETNPLISPVYGYYPHLTGRRHSQTPDERQAMAAQAAELGLSMAPGSGEAMSARDAWNASGAGAAALQAGQYGEAASQYGNMLAGIAGAVPGAGVIARGTKRGAAWMERNVPAGINRLLDKAMPADPQNTMNIFAGPTAKTADKTKMLQAELMEKFGDDKDKIWKDTGWFRGHDGGWRFEIDDSPATLSHEAAGEIAATGKAASNLNRLIDHPEFYAAYPGDAGLPTVIRQSDVSEGAFHSDMIGEPMAIEASGNTSQRQVGVTLHEMQHLAQKREGFTPGGNPEVARDHRTPEEMSADKRHISRVTLRTLGAAKAQEDAGNLVAANTLRRKADALKMLWQRMQPEGFGPYWRTPGEVEARNVQNRMNLTAQQRQALPPWTTQDVPSKFHSLSARDAYLRGIPPVGPE